MHANPYRISSRLVAPSLLGIMLLFTTALATRPLTSRAQAIATVKSILQRNAGACRLSHGLINATRVKVGWRVSTKLRLSGRGNATAVWTVREDNGEAVPGNQLTAEISNGCP